MTEHRQTDRKLVGLLVKLAHKGVDDFAARYATNLSDGGMFIRTREPRPIGSELAFKVEIANGQRVLQGIALVKWTRGENDPGGPPGMGLEFLKLDEASRALVDRMLGKPSPTPTTPVAVPSIPRVPVITPVKAPVVAPVMPRATASVTSLPYELPPSTEEAPEPAPGSEIDIDLDALVSGTPAPPPESAFDAAMPAFDVDLEAVEPAPPPAPPPPLPPITHSVSPAPRAERPTAPAVLTPAPSPVLTQAATASVTQPTTKTGPVFLKDIRPSDGTGPVIGIDLGTTNTACAILSKGRPVILSSRDGHNTIPSVVALSAQGKLQVGHRARAQMVLNPTQSIFGAKRLVGREFDSTTVRQVKERAHFEIVAGADQRAAVRLGEHTLSLEEVQGLVLKECRDMAEQSLGTSVTRAVITCPAYYSEPQREAVRRAGAMAGLKVERVLNEPTAAALAFGMNRGLKKTVLVYDLGGGTFDATLLKLDQNVFEVMATGGDVFLGGVDFDSQVVDLLLSRFAVAHGRQFAGDRVALSRVTEVAELLKVALSERSTFDVHLPMLEMDAKGTPLDLRTTVSRADLEAVSRDLVERTVAVVQDVLLDAKLKVGQVDEVILVGGMSRMPLVREHLKQLFGKPPQASVNADEAVALGAALYTGTVDKVSSLVLIDVVPMTIGVGRPGGAFHRLIERNTALPATKSFGLSTQKDDETSLEVLVFQGEDSNVAGNDFLGAITITGLPRGKAGTVQVAITLALDAECVLRVEAREFRTRTVVRATLATRYTSEEISQRLGITAEKVEAVNRARGAELEKRAGGFWGKVKSLFRR